MQQMGDVRVSSRLSDAVQTAEDAQRDRVILSFTLLLAGLFAIFASTLPFAAPNEVLYGSTTVQP